MGRELRGVGVAWLLSECIQHAEIGVEGIMPFYTLYSVLCTALYTFILFRILYDFVRWFVPISFVSVASCALLRKFPIAMGCTASVRGLYGVQNGIYLVFHVSLYVEVLQW